MSATTSRRSRASGSSKQAAIKKFLDFAYQDTYQLQFDKEYDLLPATNSASQTLSADPIFGPFLKALPQAVQYPASAAWAATKTQIQQTIGTAITGDPEQGARHDPADGDEGQLTRPNTTSRRSTVASAEAGDDDRPDVDG